MKLCKINRCKSRNNNVARSSWCRCDFYLIKGGSKCPICGRKEPHKRNKLCKKDYNTLIDFKTFI